MPRFAIQEHYARAHDFDFRLENSGVVSVVALVAFVAAGVSRSRSGPARTPARTDSPSTAPPLKAYSP
jgi:hypothetical protein